MSQIPGVKVEHLGGNAYNYVLNDEAVARLRRLEMVEEELATLRKAMRESMSMRLSKFDDAWDRFTIYNFEFRLTDRDKAMLGSKPAIVQAIIDALTAKIRELSGVTP